MAGSSLGGGQSKSKSTSSSVDLGSNVWGTQSPYLQNLYQAAQGNLGQGQQAIDTAGQQFQQQYQTLNQFQNPSVDPRLALYGQEVGRNFGENILPQISGQAQLVGGLGNSRQQIAEGIAGRGAAESIANMGTQLYGENQDRALQSINAQNQITGQQTALPWANLQSFQGLLGAPVMQDLGGSSRSKSTSSAWNANAGFKVGP